MGENSKIIGTAAGAAVGADVGFPHFRLTRFNPRRLRPVCSGAAEVEITDSDGTFRLWMTRLDVEQNIIEFGRHPGLVAALEAYRNRVEIREGD